MSFKFCCISRCGLTSKDVILHTFPNPAYEPDRFKEWVSYCGASLQGMNDTYIFMNRRICRLHFEKKFHYRNNRLCKLAVPTLFEVHSKTINCEEDKEDSSTIPDPIKAENFLLKSQLKSFETQSQNNETMIDDNFYTMDQNKFADDFDDPIVLSTEEKENKHDKDVEFGLELRSKKDPDTMTHSDFKCNVCCGDIIGFRYTCLQCVDWDMCTSCEARGEHPEHYVLRLPAPRPHAECEPIIAAIRQQIDNLLLLSKEITSEIYFKEEPDVDSILEEFDTDLTDPFSATSDRNVPKMDLHRLQRGTHVTITDPEHKQPTDACRVDEPTSLAPGTQGVLKSSSIPDAPGKRGYILRAISATDSVKQYKRNHKSKIRIIEMSTKR